MSQEDVNKILGVSNKAKKKATSSNVKKMATSGNNKQTQEVAITDIRMPFMSIVIFMVKAAIAAIPALIILFIIWGIMAAMMGAMMGGRF